MKFTLKDYQEEAVEKMLINLSKAKKRWKLDGDRHSFSLAATTGAGKTVMAAAVFESLFHGNDNYDFEADPSATVIWFSDDPALNEQTRHRLFESSDRLDFNDLVVVENSFNRDKFESGKIYFLNTQKLGKKSLLVRGHDPDADEGQGELLPRIRPDLRSQTIWDTIQNTIEDPGLTLYLVLDEAHRGMKSNNPLTDKLTIIKRLINGQGSVPAIPIVLGISATVERFNQAMVNSENRSSLPNVVVDAAKVQASGLLKDTILLDVPKNAGRFDKVLIKRAVNKIKESTNAWAEYAKQQASDKVVMPLLIVQVPNTPDPDEIGQALDTIFKEWPDLKSESVAHVFGEHKTLEFGAHSIPYVSPERVQEFQWIRVLIAKDAISTGWDCPRAEVLISFRPAEDRTHITQLVGRMVRNPLARRISGNDRLNAVDCILPYFNHSTVEEVASALMKGGDDEGQSPLIGRRILITPTEVFPNSSVDDVVWEKFTSLQTQTLPQRGVKPVKRLTALAQELASDGLLKDAGKLAHKELYKVLDSAKVRYSEAIETARKAILTVEGETLTLQRINHNKSIEQFLEEADYISIEHSYRRAARVLNPDLARTYADYLADKNKQGDREESLVEAFADIAGLSMVPEVLDYLNAEAKKFTDKWLNEFRVQIKDLPDERQEAYRVIKEWSSEPQDIDLEIPKSWIVASTFIDTDGIEKPLPRYEKHLLVDEADNLFPSEMNSWEVKVYQTESARKDFLNWYRNPSRTSQDSLGVIYMEDEKYKILRPDFIFFSKVGKNIVADIVDPHWLHKDSLPKVKGLSVYAETHSSHFRRIESVAEINGIFKVLDLMEPKVRKAVAESDSIEQLFRDFGTNY